MKEKKIADLAYFSMEFAFSNNIPNYAGGLGILAGDTMRSCADLGINAVGVSLVYHKSDDPSSAFPIEKFMERCAEKVYVTIENREVALAIWKMEIKGAKCVVPVYFLSAYLPENEIWDRDLTKHLYAPDPYTRICQEALLGIGGVRALEALGYCDVKKYHLNEGHCSFLTLELLRRNSYDENRVRSLCSFTTHTPLPSGHDAFEYELAYKTIGSALPWNIRELAGGDKLNMTRLALNLCNKANGVSQKHGEVCREMFPEHNIGGITNGIYHPRWVGSHMKPLFDRYLLNWRQNPKVFKNAAKLLPDRALMAARKLQKKELIDWINVHDAFFPFSQVSEEDLFSEDVLTIGFARRFVPYKRPELIFEQSDILRKIGKKKIQLVFAGHRWVNDQFSNDIMKHVEHYADEFRGDVKVVLIPYYDINVAKRLISGCDVWLNTPIPPQEASGTSGMKAALNGCLNLSILDGWWIEGYKKNKLAGWAFGNKAKKTTSRDEEDAIDLMVKLEDVINCFYGRKKEWAKRMENAISLAAYFNTHRMVSEYSKQMWKGDNKQ